MVTAGARDEKDLMRTQSWSRVELHPIMGEKTMDLGACRALSATNWEELGKGLSLPFPHSPIHTHALRLFRFPQI